VIWYIPHGLTRRQRLTTDLLLATGVFFMSIDYALPFGQFPRVRPRRLRRTAFLRDLVQEHKLSTSDLILPLFVQEGTSTKTPILSMHNTFRYTIDELVKHCQHIVDAQIPAIALFPYIDPAMKTNLAEEAYNSNGLVPRAVASVKQAYPELGVITDVALDPYTIHGQDGIMNDQHEILNDITIEALAKQALSHAQAGADIVAPSDMMDGRIGFVRERLEKNGFTHVAILAYSAKYASTFYGPFRDAVGSAGQLAGADKKTYQLNPANGAEALLEATLDCQEGADILMVKPGMPYLDILWRVTQNSSIPVFVYQVSGEYAMLQNAISQNLLPESAILETMIAFKRAGANAILTYSALDVARLMS